MLPFEQTSAFRTAIDEISRGLVSGGGLGHFIQGSDLDRNEQYAYQAGNLAYTATNGDIVPALLAMVVHGKLAGSKAEVFGKIQELGVQAKDVDDVFRHNGQPINYRMFWDDTVSKTLVENFPKMSLASRVAVLAHIITVIDVTNNPEDPAPAPIKKAVQQVSFKLLKITEQNDTPLAIELAHKLTPPSSNGRKALRYEN